MTHLHIWLDIGTMQEQPRIVDADLSALKQCVHVDTAWTASVYDILNRIAEPLPLHAGDWIIAALQGATSRKTRLSQCQLRIQLQSRR